jgi:hypothetical protein
MSGGFAPSVSLSWMRLGVWLTEHTVFGLRFFYNLITHIYRGCKMKKLTVLLIFFTAFATQANAALITFDLVSDGTIINNQYSGVTFTTLFSGVDGGNVYARSDASAESPSNVISIFGTGIPSFDNRYGTIHAAFSSAQTSVSIDTLLTGAAEGFGNSGTGYLKAYNSGVLLGTSTTTTLGAWNTLSFSGSGITDAYFTVQYNGDPTYGLFDNFNYGDGSNGNGGGVISPVPEPETYAMLLVGLGLIGFMARRRKDDFSF